MFSVSTKTQYGIRALVHLARNESTGATVSINAPEASSSLLAEATVTGAAIAQAERISPKYLEGILGQLTTAGLLVSERGKHGGYRLARSSASITMLEIVEALEGQIRPVGCVDSRSPCAQEAGCLPRLFWRGLKESVDGYLSSRTLRDIIDPDVA